MSTDARRQAIIRYVQEHDLVSVNHLIGEIEGSPATIRRDLRFLEENGVVSRSHGFVKRIPPSIVSNLPITEAQTKVAQAAAAMVPENATILLDSGISAVALARELTDRRDLTIITNSLSVANLMRHAEPHILLTGGELDGRQEALVGLDAENYIRGIHVPCVFLTTTGIRRSEGLVCVTAQQASLKQQMIRSARKTIVLADHDKIQKDSVRVFAVFEDVDVIITDAPADPQFAEALKEKGVELIIAE